MAPAASRRASRSRKVDLGTSGPSARRRSQRLASKQPNSNEIMPDSLNSDQKHQNAATMTDNGSFTVDDKIGGKFEFDLNSSCTVCMESGVRVSDSTGGKDAVVLEESGVEMAWEVKEEEEKHVDVQDGIGKLGQVAIDTRKKGKRKPGELSSLGGGIKLESHSDTKFLSLRSGTKIAKRTLEGSINVGQVISNGGTVESIADQEEEVKHEEEKEVLIVKDSEDEEDYGVERPMKSVPDTAEEVKRREGKEVLIVVDSEEEDFGVECEMGDRSILSPMEGSKYRGKFTREAKGKAKMDEMPDDTGDVGLELTLGLKYFDLNEPLGSDLGIHEGSSMQDVGLDDGRTNEGSEPQPQVPSYTDIYNYNPAEERKKQWKRLAKANAYRLAHFSDDEEATVNHPRVAELPSEDISKEVENWPGPFSTALKIIKDREKKSASQEQYFSTSRSGAVSVKWTPSRKEKGQGLRKVVTPSLVDMCLAVLARNVDAITSLEYVPDPMRHKLSQMLCDSRKMNHHFLDILVQGSPAEIRLRDCSWLTEEQFTTSFERCCTENLVVLQLDQCGRCIADYIIQDTLASRNLSALTSLSLKGACRLSDDGLTTLVAAAPSLRSMNLSQCSLLTENGIHAIASSLGSVLRELYLDHCQGLEAFLILPAFKELRGLEVLSFAGIHTISDEFIREFIGLNGRNLKELILTDCIKLTDSSVKMIAQTCSDLRALDLFNLTKLTDLTMGYLGSGRNSLQTLKLCRNSFSDEAVAAFIEASGETMKELSLNNVRKVGHNTAISLARRCKNMMYLDLSWCRSLTDEALGLIADSCMSLRVLSIFGCTQISRSFVDGHSNANLQIVGLKLTPILEHRKEYNHYEGHFRYSSGSGSAPAY